MFSGKTENGCKGMMIHTDKRKNAGLRIYSEFTITESSYIQAITNRIQGNVRLIVMTVASAFYQTLWNCLPRQTAFSTYYCGSL